MDFGPHDEQTRLTESTGALGATASVLWPSERDYGFGETERETG